MDAALFRSKFNLKALLAHRIKYYSLDAAPRKKYGDVVKFHPLFDWEACGLWLGSDWLDATIEARGKERLLCKRSELKDNATEPPCNEIYLETWGEDWDAEYTSIMSKDAEWVDTHPAKIVVKGAGGTLKLSLLRICSRESSKS